MTDLIQDLDHVAEAQPMDDTVTFVLDIEPHVKRQLPFRDLLSQQFPGGLKRPVSNGCKIGEFGTLWIMDQRSAVPEVKMISAHHHILSRTNTIVMTLTCT